MEFHLFATDTYAEKDFEDEENEQTKETEEETDGGTAVAKRTIEERATLIRLHSLGIGPRNDSGLEDNYTERLKSIFITFSRLKI